MHDVRQPTFMRYARVEAILLQERSFHDRVVQRTEQVLKPDGKSHLFSKEVIAVTQAIHDAGHDAHKVAKLDIIMMADGMFEAEKATAAISHSLPSPPPSQPSTSTPTAPPPSLPPSLPTATSSLPPPQAPPPTSLPPPLPPTPPISPAPAPLSVPVRRKRGRPRRVDVLPPTPPPPQSPPVAAPPEVKPSEVPVVEKIDKVTEAAKAPEAGINQNPYVSMYSLAMTIGNLTEMYDSQPGNERRLKTITDLTAEYLHYARM